MTANADGLAMERYSVRSATTAKFINKCLLLVLLPGVIRRLQLKPISEPKVDNMFVNQPYCQTAWYVLYFICQATHARNPIVSGHLSISFLPIIHLIKIFFSTEASNLLNSVNNS